MSCWLHNFILPYANGNLQLSARFLPIRLVASTDRNIRAKGQRGFLTFSTLSFFCAYNGTAHSHIRTNAHTPICTHTHDAHAHIRHDVRHAIRHRTAPPYIQNAHRLIRKIARPLIRKMHGHIYIIAQGYIRPGARSKKSNCQIFAKT